MGGSHKKKLRAEKAKVKLKGVKLPKGLNVTKTEFKVRKIVLREQLQGTQYAEGQKQVNLKEILSKLKHHSSNFRIEALRNLRDTISANHSDLLSSLNHIIQGTAAVSLDLERDARRESFKTLSSLLGQFSTNSISPFFHIISSYLCCAMTHIRAAIQEDSLLMLDVLLQHVPQLVAEQSEKIFKNFLEMISRVRADGDKAGRMLTVNMGQKQTAIKWRSNVLLRLQQMMECLAEHKRKGCAFSSKTNNRGSVFVTFSTKADQYYGIKRCLATNELCAFPSIFDRSLSENSVCDELRMLNSFVDHLMPLLLESWLEVRPHQESNCDKTETMLTLDAAATLKIVLEIIVNLWSLIEIYEQGVNNYNLSTCLKDQYAYVFAANFLQASYPYEQITFEESDGTVKSKNKKPPIKMSPHCFQQNITIVFLMCRFYANTLDKQAAKFKALIEYITKVVGLIHPQMANDHFKPLVPTLRALLLENGLKLLHIHGQATSNLLRSCVKAFLMNKFSEVGINSKILILICEIVQNSELYAAYSSEELVQFLKYLPKLLLKPTVNVSCLVAMSKLAKRKNTLFLDALRSSLPQIVNHLQTIQVIGAVNVFEGRKHIMNLFYWLKPQTSINKDELETLLNNVETKITDKRIAGYCQYILTIDNS